MDLLLFNERSVFGDLNARNELEVLDNIYADRTIITANSANILNILSESSAINPEEEVIRKRGRRKIPKISQLPLRRSPRKSATATTETATTAAVTATISSSGDHLLSPNTADDSLLETRDYFLRTPKKTPQKSANSGRTPRKTPSKSSATPSTPSRRVSPRKRLQLDGNDSGLGLTPSPSTSTPSVPSGSGGFGHKCTPISSMAGKTAKSSPKSLVMTKRRRRRYF